MSITVQHLVKVYGAQKALDDISFSIGEGEIVGFLGPNGAGKSTTMKIATGYIPPTAGLVDIGGYSVVGDPRKVKQIIGYLPENNPVYPDMFVHEYLRFIGQLYGLRRQGLRSRVSEMIERCGLTGEQNKKIENLSKGYRQRVGLAQALIHDPRVLILDEPTSGLDPNQLSEIRRLIRDISANKTVLFSTHIMQEVEALCDRVILINRGRIVADDSLAKLRNTSKSANVVVVQFESAIDPAQLRKIPSVADVIPLGSHIYRMVSENDADLRPGIFRFAADNNLSLVGLKQEENSLESIFQELTR
jgi:ABC-2 type transport system ATP-binding protein